LKITKSETSEHATQGAPSRMPRCPSEAARARDVRTSCGRTRGWGQKWAWRRPFWVDGGAYENFARQFIALLKKRAYEIIYIQGGPSEDMFVPQQQLQKAACCCCGCWIL